MSGNEAQAIADHAERLTWAEICCRYPDEWVIMSEIDSVNDTDFEFRSALVLGHYKHRADASRCIKSAFAYCDEIGCYWTGRLRGPIPRFMIP